VICVTATIRVAAGKGDEAAALFAAIVEAVREEEGTVAYTVARGVDDDDLFTVFELYGDEAALDAHRAGRAYTVVQAPLRHLLEGRPEVITARVTATAR
jgi:quinol monooxygenase YgiN